MDLQRLRYFRTVAHMEHMSKAAQKLHITQPALSKTIALLEEEVGGPLFARVGRKIELNEHGRTFLHYVEQALDAVDSGLELLKEFNRPGQGQKIRLQTNILSRRYLFELLRSFRHYHPDVIFEVITTYSKSKYLEDCDCYIASERISFYRCTSVPLMRDAVLLGVSEMHHLAGQQSICLTDVAQEDFIGMPRNFSWTEETESFCLEAGFKPNYRIVSDKHELVQALVAAGEGVAFCLEKSQDNDTPGMKLLRISHPQCFRQYNLSWQTHKTHSPIAQEFIRFVKEYFHA